MNTAPVRNTLLLSVAVGTPLFFALMFIGNLEAKLAAIITVAGVLLWNFATAPRHYALSGAVALGFALFITTAHHYEYTTANLFIGHVNLFPFVMWTAGLMLTREVYLRLPVRYKLLSATILYITLLFALEYLGYYWAGIQLTPGLPGFLGTNVLHGTPVMHLFYPTAGPVFILLTDLLTKYTPWLSQKIELQ